MAFLDWKVLAVALVLSGTIVSIGKAVDGLLLARHVRWLDDLSMRAWYYLDDVRFRDVPRSGLIVFLHIKKFVVGSGFGVAATLRAICLSLVLTTIAMPLGRALGLYLFGVCQRMQDPNFSGTVLSFSDSVRSSLTYYSAGQFAALMSSNIVFDILTIFITTAILLVAVRKSDFGLTALIGLDIAACVVLLHGLWFLADQLDTGSAVTQFGILEALPTIVFYLGIGCSGFDALLTKLLFVSTVLIPTLIYMFAIFFIALFRGGFLISRWFGLHILERSVEDERKSIIGHSSAALGILVALGGAVQAIIQVA